MENNLVWIANTRSPLAEGETLRFDTIEQWNAHVAWFAKQTTGQPKATDHRTVEEFEAMGYVGIYRKESITEEKQRP